MQTWFINHQEAGWATCPLTENEMVRVLSQPSYPSGQRAPVEVITVLRALKESFSSSHHFWPDNFSLSDPSIFHAALIAGTKRVTDIYLLGLTARRKGRLVSFDHALAWQAIQGGSRNLIERP